MGDDLDPVRNYEGGGALVDRTAQVVRIAAHSDGRRQLWKSVVWPMIWGPNNEREIGGLPAETVCVFVFLLCGRREG